MQVSSDFPKTDSPVSACLLALAPLRLINHRRVRYVGDDLCVDLDRMAARDQILLRALYRQLTELLRVIADPSTDDAQRWEGVQSWIDHHDLDKLIDEVREIGLASHGRTREKSSPRLCTMCVAERSARSWAACNSSAICV